MTNKGKEYDEDYSGTPVSELGGCRHIILKTGEKCGKPIEGKIPYCPDHTEYH